MQSPFTLDKSKNHINEDYLTWRAKKRHEALEYSQIDPSSLLVNIENPDNPSASEIQKISSACNKYNFCLYKTDIGTNNKKSSINSLAKHLGLSRLDTNLCADSDSLTSITNTTHKGQHEYIPYSTKRLNWHTDGYYNTSDHTIHSMLLHCASPAKEGGESLLMDHEMAYLLLRDENPNYIKALMQADAMTIPANILDEKVIRKAQTGPVFSVTRSGLLHMRYSARKRNIEWKQTPSTLEAVSFLEDLLESNSKYIIRYALKAGEGLLCRNILHRRTAFVDFEEDNKKRLLYRGRYFDELTL